MLAPFQEEKEKLKDTSDWVLSKLKGNGKPRPSGPLLHHRGSKGSLRGCLWESLTFSLGQNLCLNICWTLSSAIAFQGSTTPFSPINPLATSEVLSPYFSPFSYSIVTLGQLLGASLNLVEGKQFLSLVLKLITSCGSLEPVLKMLLNPSRFRGQSLGLKGLEYFKEKQLLRFEEIETKNSQEQSSFEVSVLL